MKNKKIITSILIIVIIIIGLLIGLVVYPSMHEKECKNRVYEDMQEKVDTVKDSVIGVIPKTEEDGNITYGGGGSGVIFDYQDGTYYALTAAHCVNGDNTTYKIYTTKTVDVKEDVPSEYIDVYDSSYYESLANAKIEYISSTTDLAIISFKSNDNLKVAKVSNTLPSKKDHIMCIGNPESDKFIVTYGEITSDKKEISAESITKDSDTKLEYTAIEHNAYIYFGNSGGPAFNEDMEVVGINVSGTLSLLGKFESGALVPCDDIQKCINEWEK